MSSDNQAGDKARLLALIAAAIIILAIAIWVSFDSDEKTSSATGASTSPQVSESVTAESAVDATTLSLAPSFDVVRISRGGTGVIAGRAAPGSIVELYSNKELIATKTADKTGDWVAILRTPLLPGSAELNIIARNPETGNTIEADKVVVVSVPEQEEDTFIERQESGVIAVLSPRDGVGPSKIMQRPARGFREVGDSLSVSTIDYTSNMEGNEGNAIVTGQALPRVWVRLYMDDIFIDTMKATDDGTWQLAVPQSKLTQGKHILRVDQTLDEGSVQLRIEQPFEMGEAIDPAQSEGGVIVKPGNTLWHIARQLYGSGVQYTVIFMENSDQIRDPDKIYPGQVFALPKKE